MIDLLTGIQTAFSNNATLASSFANGLEVSLASDAEALPLCVLTIQPSTLTHQTGASPYVEQPVGQFTVYHQGANPDFGIELEPFFEATFHNQQIALSTDSCLIGYRTGGGNPYRDMDGRVWRVDYFYRFVVQKNT